MVGTVVADVADVADERFQLIVDVVDAGFLLRCCCCRG